MFTHKAISALNELELTVYNYIVKNGDKVMYMTIRDWRMPQVSRPRQFCASARKWIATVIPNFVSVSSCF